jgi:hypothetical protein
MIRYDQYPNGFQTEEVRDFIERGAPLGDFLLALTMNDLRETCRRADDMNRHLIFNIVAWFWTHAPAGCWGSEANVIGWMKRGGLHGRSAATETEGKDDE